jgi:hypothetical protein
MTTVTIIGKSAVCVDYNDILDLLKFAMTGEEPEFDVRDVATDLFNAIGYPGRSLCSGRVKSLEIVN